MKTLPIDYLRECFGYNPQTGQLYWKLRPRTHFNSNKGWNGTNARCAGNMAGTINNVTGRLLVKVSDVNLLVHRVCFAIHRGYWPADQLDHKDGDHLNNRIDNLREATNLQNAKNRKKHTTNKSGYTGVVARGDRWIAQICSCGKVKHLGIFNSKEDAHAAYLKAAAILHGEFAAAHRGKE